MSGWQLVISLLIPLIANEITGYSDWLARRITCWAAGRWKDKQGHDYLQEWIDDLKELPTPLLRLLSACWLALGTIVPPHWLTLNLPSLWRLSQPLLHVGARVLQLVAGVITARAKGYLPRAATVGRWHGWILEAAVLLLPAGQRDRFAHEWSAELLAIPDRRERRQFVVSIALGAPRFAILLRFAGSRRA
ncbi:hypothetical protein [Actinomadura sp. 9N215]|uniref:hypothetical protein n=1 Tax=Actinomadura sp. 9N215 TaxID=3375150 RepID=UPI00378B6869